MRVKKEHLRKRGKVTLSVPSEDMAFIESLIERFPDVPFSRLVISALREKFGEKGTLTSLGGSFKKYSRGRIEDTERVLQEVASNAAHEGLDS